jgi:phosphate transport system permease protein
MASACSGRNDGGVAIENRTIQSPQPGVRIRPEDPTIPIEVVDNSSGGTTLPLRPSADGPRPRPRRIGGVRRGDLLNLAGAAATGLCVALLLFGRLASFSGLIAFVVVVLLVFLGTYAALVSLTDDGPAVRDKVMTVILWTLAGLVFLSLVSVIVFTLWRGRQALTQSNFFTEDMSKAGSLAPISVGGIKHALVGTLWMIGIALAFTVPLGLICAIYLNEVHNRFSRFVRTIVEAMTALPSIVAGLFIFATWILSLHFLQSGFAAALALSVMMLPIIIRAADVVLRLVPGTLREASIALGAPSWRTMRYVVLPTARSGLATAVILGTARGIGETSPVLLTAGFTNFYNGNPFHGPMVSLPLATFIFVRTGLKPMIARGFGAASVLLVVVLVLFVIARILGGRGAGQLTRRKARRRARSSARDVARFETRAAARLASGE